MEYKLYKEQEKIWPAEGQHILANYDENSISVYQAHRPAIADYAVKHQKFGGEFSFTRMSWIKPKTLWGKLKLSVSIGNSRPGERIIIAGNI